VGFEYIPTLRRLAGSKKYPPPVDHFRPVEKSKPTSAHNTEKNKKQIETKGYRQTSGKVSVKLAATVPS